MSHFAEIDENNIVIRVLVGNPELSDEDGLQFMNEAFGGRWIQTSFNTIKGMHLHGQEPLRKNYAGIGMIYDETRDAFLYPKPYDSWILDENTCWWQAPIEHPNDGNMYEWNEEKISWIIKEV